VLKTGAITGAAASVAAAGSIAVAGTADAAPKKSAGQRTSPGEDLILRNGRIHTTGRTGGHAAGAAAGLRAIPIPDPPKPVRRRRLPG
jgi:hypothetical protein